jgi:arylsulfate sulfotransferase
MNRTWKVKAYLAVGLGLALGTLGCGGGGGSASTVRTLATLTPKAGAVLTGQTQQMTFTPGSGGSSNVTWTVNGVTGGDATVGTIDTSGLYTAPAVPPSPNYATIRAASGTESALAVLTIVNPSPSVSSLTPVGTTLGSGDTLITVNGAGFTPQSVISVAGTPLTTTFVSNSELTATFPASMVASGIAVDQVTVSTLGPGGGTSSPLSFTILWSGGPAGTGNPQVAAYSMVSPRNANVTIQFGVDTSYGLRTWTRPTATDTGGVTIFVAGMKAFTTYHMRAVVDFLDGTEFMDADHTFTTGGLPASRLPHITVTTPNGLTPAPGVELMSMVGVVPTPGNLLPPDQNPVHAAAYDTEGNLIWYCDYDESGGIGGGVQPVKLLSNGDMIFISTPGNLDALEEVDLRGNIVRYMNYAQLEQKLANAGIDAPNAGMDHEVIELPNRHLMVLASITRDFTDLPGYPGALTVNGNMLVELDQNWNPVWTWNTFDHLDVNRHPYGLPDWTHGNAIVYSPDDGNLLFSMRNQDWVIKIDYDNGQGSGNILWNFGYQGDFTLDAGAPAAWQYGQHYPIFLSPNTTGNFKLGVYDDGNNRVMDDAGDVCGSTGQPACYSRVPIYQVDENAKTAHVDWEDSPLPFTFAVGSMQVLSNNDVEFDLGVLPPGTPPFSARVMEVTQDTNPQTVWQLDLTGQVAYRALRIPSLYPGVEW